MTEAVAANFSSDDLRQYLLGQMSDAERDRLEEQYFTDDSLTDELLAAESELIEGYLDHSLPDVSRRAFERNYLVTAERQQRLATALNLRAKASTINPPTPASDKGQLWWRRLVSKALPQSPRLGYGFTFATAFLIVTAIGLGFYVVKLRSRLQNTSRDLADARGRAASEEERLKLENGQLRNQITGEQQRSTELAQSLDEQIERKPEAPPVPSFNLTGGQIGGIGVPTTAAPSDKRVERIVIPGNARIVRLTMELGVAPGVERYSVGIKNAQGVEITGSAPPSLRVRRDRAAATVFIPAGLLSSGEYLLTVTGQTSDGKTEPLALYRLKVEKSR